MPKHDSSEYNNLTAIRDTMIEILTEMQSVNIRAYYVYFGDTRDVRRLEAIPDEYAKTVNRLTAYVDSARRLPLIARERAETDKLVDYAQSLADEFTKLRKHFKCVVENTCSLLEQ